MAHTAAALGVTRDVPWGDGRFQGRTSVYIAEGEWHAPYLDYPVILGFPLPKRGRKTSGDGPESEDVRRRARGSRELVNVVSRPLPSAGV